MHEKIFGTVVRGLGRGKEFGFPTVNIKLVDNDLHIGNGAYVAVITINNRIFNGMLYVGTRPTLGLQETTIEIHILDFKEEIYNQPISFQILHKIRDEIRFENVNALVEQLHRDKKMVYGYLSSISFNSSKQ